MASNFLTLPTQYRDFLNKKGGPGLTSMDDRLDFIIIELWNLLVLMNSPVTPPPDGGGGTEPPTAAGPGYPLNRPTFITGRKILMTAGVAEQLTTSTIVVPDGMAVTVMAAPTNAGTVRVGPSKSDAEGASAFNGLSNGLAIGLFIKDVSSIWATSTSDGDIVAYIVEQG
jgi:hypothetical protein